MPFCFAVGGYEILIKDKTLGVGVSGNAFVIMFYGPPTVDVLNRLYEVEKKTIGGKRYAIVSIVDPRVGMEMTREARQRANQIGNEMEPFTICMAFIVFGTGFFGAMVRSVIAGVQLFTQQKNPWKVMANIPEAVTFVDGMIKNEGKSAPLDNAALTECIEVLVKG